MSKGNKGFFGEKFRQQMGEEFEEMQNLVQDMFSSVQLTPEQEQKLKEEAANVLLKHKSANEKAAKDLVNRVDWATSVSGAKSYLQDFADNVIREAFLEDALNELMDMDNDDS